MERFQAAAAEYERNIARARKLAAGAFDPLDPPTIAFLAEAYRVERIEQDEAARWDQEERELFQAVSEQLRQANAVALNSWEGRESVRWMEKRRETVEGFLPTYRHFKAAGDLDGLVNWWAEEVLEFTGGRGFVVDPKSDGFRQLCRAVNDAAIGALEVALQRLDGQEVPTPPEPRLEPSQAPAPVAVGKSFQAIVEAILTSPRHPVSEATKESTRTALRFFRETHGQPQPERITRAMVTEWLELLAKRPARVPWAERKLALLEIVERYQDRSDVARLSPKTQEQHLGMLAAAWTKAEDDGLIAEGVTNPFKRKRQRQRQTKRVTALTNQDLQAIFRLPVFAEGERPAGGKGDASYWIPLLLLWTGARPEEVAQLVLADIAKDKDSGRWMLEITDEGEHPHKGTRSLKTSRTLSGRRCFPIPQPLLDLGFVAYLKHLRSAGDTALFPMLRTKGKRGYLHSGWAMWWGSYLRLHGLMTAGDGKRPAREFRHAWTTAARSSGIAREAQEYIQGHRTPGGSAHEDYGSKEPLGLQIDRLRFEGLDLSQVKPWTPAT